MFAPRDEVWHGPGLNWVRTPNGWRREGSTNNGVEVRRSNSPASGSDVLKNARPVPKDLEGCSQPFIHVIGSFSKEVIVAETTMTQVLTRLQLEDAIKDTRRFHYVCKLVELILEDKFPRMSGQAQKHLIMLLDRILDHVIETENHLNVARRLAHAADEVLVKNRHDHMGSQRMWDQHCDTVNKMRGVLDGFLITERKDDDMLMLTELPDDVMMEILLRFDDSADISRFACTSRRMHTITKRDKIWRSLTLCHFREHLNTRQRKNTKTMGWKKIYSQLEKKHRKRVDYAECLCLCSYCHSLFWQLHGHRCLESRANSDVIAQEKIITPEACVKMFPA